MIHLKDLSDEALVDLIAMSIEGISGTGSDAICELAKRAEQYKNRSEELENMFRTIRASLVLCSDYTSNLDRTLKGADATLRSKVTKY